MTHHEVCGVRRLAGRPPRLLARIAMPRPAPAWVIVMASAIASCGPADRAVPTPADAGALPVRVATARQSGPTTQIVAIGTVARQREANLAFRLPGVITVLTVDDGDRVERGDLLSRIDATDLSARLASARAEAQRADRTAARFASLAATGAIARSLYEDQRTIARQMREAEAVAAFEARSATLLAPASGTILRRVAQSGETVTAGQTVLRLADRTSPIIVRVPLPDADAQRVRPGSAATFRLNADTPLLRGHVSRIGGSTSSSTATRSVEVTLDAADGLESGMIGTVFIAGSQPRRSGEVRLPAEALAFDDGGHSAVFVARGRPVRAVSRRVAFIRFDGNDVVIRGDGITAGMPVVTAGAGHVRDGQPLIVEDVP
ncbi:efflux RND transporter periplasmic adaptor subunit [Sphingomonas prati]|uniref:RND family efflux transporter MFP subunit n=1 Tax=Sphingomonas prati TaxID=1843237 RepID=A0A7W9BSA6_9SPHN|nr:efflux RND transporter periplasmic adaptor subunit [Sphingomonas prati]MBB5729071.1 RND family efflux transporter MFP subunit [Sphingomonas prati]GGE85329.1 transporter [Sphingomonas prati]